MLRRSGLACATASSGAEALQKLDEALLRRESFGLLITDCQMPEMDGFELVRRIREKGEHYALAMLMLCSSVRSGDGRKVRDLSINACLTKPIRRAELLEAIHKCLGRTAPEIQPVQPAPNGSGPEQLRLKILLAEDNRINQLVARRLLERKGHQVSVATNGNEVLALHAQDPSKFDLILMDIQMPEKDGFETALMIRDREKLSQAHIPIVALTAHAMNGDRERCTAAGMDGYIAKPIRMDELEAEIKRCGSGVLAVVS